MDRQTSKDLALSYSNCLLFSLYYSIYAIPIRLTLRTHKSFRWASWHQGDIALTTSTAPLPIVLSPAKNALLRRIWTCRHGLPSLQRMMGIGTSYFRLTKLNWALTVQIPIQYRYTSRTSLLRHRLAEFPRILFGAVHLEGIVMLESS